MTYEFTIEDVRLLRWIASSSALSPSSLASVDLYDLASRIEAILIPGEDAVLVEVDDGSSRDT